MARPSNAREVSDAHLWLEEVMGEKALQWVVERNDESIRRLTTIEGFTALNDRLLKIYNSHERIPYISKRGSHYYNFWRDAKHPRGVWRRTTLEEYRKAEPQWETVLDLDHLADKEKESWVWKDAVFLKPSCLRCLLKLSRGGGDATVVREFDTETKTFVEDGFVLPEAKSLIAWREIDSVLVSTDFGPGSLNEMGYSRFVKEWRRHTPLTDATTVFEGQSSDAWLWSARDLTRGYERDFVTRRPTSWTTEHYVRRDGELVRIETPDDAEAEAWRELLLIQLRSDWESGGRTYPAGALLGTDFEAFLNGERKFAVLFQPSKRKALGDFSATRHHVILNELDNVTNRLYVLTPGDETWHREPLPDAPQLSTVSVSAEDPDESNAYLMHVTDYLTPTRLYRGVLGSGRAEKLKRGPSFFDRHGLSVSQHEVTSKDGTRVPYFEVARPDLARDGKNATLLYGYGGFEIQTVPWYDATVGAAWLEKGGVYVVANIRGGGEFGPQWHQAALKADRPRAYEDFIAVAEDLIQRKITTPEHLGCMGGSNGGLLVGNMLTLRPDLFGAIVCQVPLLDMRRYHKLLSGASWTGEYGNPDDPEQWEFVRKFSPYHNVSKDAKYPNVLIMSSTRDDRVHPGHARKMVARMRAMGHDVLYYESIEGGHSDAANHEKRALESALAYTFLWNELTPPVKQMEPQD